jgi:Mor family transcriptional regulator
MGNILDDLTENLTLALKRIEQLEKVKLSVPERIPFPEFLKQEGITRPTGYKWAQRGLIRMEKIGGRNFVLADSISIQSKKHFRSNEETANHIKDLFSKGMSKAEIARKLNMSRSNVFYYLEMRD